ncbi:unnamed protein product [Urochloa humidicola]
MAVACRAPTSEQKTPPANNHHKQHLKPARKRLIKKRRNLFFTSQGTRHDDDGKKCSCPGAAGSTYARSGRGNVNGSTAGVADRMICRQYLLICHKSGLADHGSPQPCYQPSPSIKPVRRCVWISFTNIFASLLLPRVNASSPVQPRTCL